MLLRINIMFVCEGGTDSALLQHLEALCVRSGADEVTGIYPDLGLLPQRVGKSISEKVRAALQLEPNIDIIFIHRDSDSSDPEPRYREINREMHKVGSGHNYVSVIPVQETEAWLLTDEASIRIVAENPQGTNNLGLPRISKIERTKNPKEKLKNAIACASETSGKRLRRINGNFSSKRRQLIERLDIDGNNNELTSWRRLVEARTACFYPANGAGIA